jgi:hypothetical protein
MTHLTLDQPVVRIGSDYDVVIPSHRTHSTPDQPDVHLICGGQAFTDTPLINLTSDGQASVALAAAMTNFVPDRRMNAVPYSDRRVIRNSGSQTSAASVRDLENAITVPQAKSNIDSGGAARESCALATGRPVLSCGDELFTIEAHSERDHS